MPASEFESTKLQLEYQENLIERYQIENSKQKKEIANLKEQIKFLNEKLGRGGLYETRQDKQ